MTNELATDALMENYLFDALNDYGVNAGIADVQAFMAEAGELLTKLAAKHRAITVEADADA